MRVRVLPDNEHHGPVAMRMRMTSSATVRAGTDLECSEWYADDPNERDDLEHESHLTTTNHNTHKVRNTRVDTRREEKSITQVTYQANSPAASNLLTSTSQPQKQPESMGQRESREGRMKWYWSK